MKAMVYVGRRQKSATVLQCECGTEMATRRASVEAPYVYTLSGLKDVSLAGILVRQCPKCNTEVPIIPRLGELHRLIARGLVRKPSLLRGDEVRFLRKHAGFAANRFAALLRVSPEHLSRIENGKTAKLGPVGDKLVRAIVTAEQGGDESTRRLLLETADRLLQQQQAPPRAVFTLVRNRWRTAA